MGVDLYDHRVHHIQVRLTHRSENLMMVTREDGKKDRAVRRNNKPEHTDSESQEPHRCR
jgi:hypothetical protein